MYDEMKIARKALAAYKEDFEFYKTPDGKMNVDKVMTTTAKSGLSYRDGTPNKSGDTSNVVRRVPYSKMSDDDKDLAKAAYKTLKMNGDIEEVDKKFKTSPRPDVVVKADGSHADIYYDDNTTGEPDEKNVRLIAEMKDLNRRVREAVLSSMSIED